MKANGRGMHMRALATALIAALAGSAEAQQKCINKWESSPAYDYCPDATVTAGRDDDGRRDCTVTAQCLISAVNLYDNRTTRYHVSLSETEYPRKVAMLDICFIHTNLPELFLTNVRTGCESDETDSATATSVGLQQPSE